MNAVRFPVWVLLAAFVCGVVGCATQKPTPDPLEGWKFCWSQDPSKLDKAIGDDYTDYIQKLPPEEKKFVGSIHTYEDEAGQHAVAIGVNLSGTRWRHVLIYDKENKRIKVVKYTSGYYRS